MIRKTERFPGRRGLKEHADNHFKWLAGLAAMALLLAQPQAAARGALWAMACWQTSVAPALFPFLALMPLLTCREAAMAYQALLGRPMAMLFNLPGAAVPGAVMGMAAGTPAGAMAARSIAPRAGLNRGQLQRLAAATAGFSPAFLVSGIGVGMLKRASLGWRLLGVQLMTQATMALLLRNRWQRRSQPVPPVEDRHEERPVRAAVLGILTVCGYMTLFGALAEAAGACLGQGPADVVLCLLDVPSGARRVADMALAEEIKLPLLAAMCGFGGLCVIVQGLAALGDCAPGVGEYIALRTLAGLIGAGYMALWQRLPDWGRMEWRALYLSRPLATGALIAALLALPILKKWKYTHS